MNIYLIGSIAFDELSFYAGKFSDVIKPEQLGSLSVSFVVEDMVQFLGGCAGNIAYTLGLLHVPASICSFVGDDGGSYKVKLIEWGMNLKHLETRPGRTAHAFITSDKDENQITHFAPGVIGADAPAFKLPEEAAAGDLLFVAPENRDRMMQAVKSGADRGMRVFFDPGQMIHSFNPYELQELLELSEALFVNEYELGLLKTITGLEDSQLADKVDSIFVTLGEKGVYLYQKGVLTEIPALLVKNPVDPTGAGDAFRAGVIASLKKGLDIEKAARVGTILGAACVGHKQTQGYELNEAQVHELGKLGFAL